MPAADAAGAYHQGGVVAGKQHIWHWCIRRGQYSVSIVLMTMYLARFLLVRTAQEVHLPVEQQSLMQMLSAATAAAAAGNRS